MRPLLNGYMPKVVYSRLFYIGFMMDIISSSDMEIYRKSARKRQQALRESRRIRHEHAWEVARRAASLLRKHFAASRVVVFGSLLRPEVFDERSDVDMAVWGVTDEKYLRAVAAVTALDKEISLDLIKMEPGLQSNVAISSQIEAGMEI